MQKLIIVLVAILFSSLIFSQNAVINISNQKTGVTLILQEKSRIRIKTVDGKKITGRFQILNDSTLLLRGKEISLANIKKIKRNPLAMTIATDVILFVVGGTITAVTAFSDGTEIAVLLGTTTLGTMLLGPNFLKGYSTNKYTIEFVTN